jgi:hypothetical protein
VKERPILFSGPMVRAILDGMKTQTRRVVKQTFHGCLTGDCPHWDQKKCERTLRDLCPYGQPGDRLWVREAVADEGECAVYVADGSVCERIGDWVWKRKFLPPMFMPRGASRITLEIAGVRVERLQEISEEDARAEGVRGQALGHEDPEGDRWKDRSAFKDLWDSINGGNLNHGGGPHAWAQNPWVWVVEFKWVAA